MKKFPVKIDLSTFFQDERKFVIILVDPEWKSVENLQHRVEEIFNVRPVNFLTNDGLFIPPQESVEVVEYTESLKAYIPQHAIEESRRRSKHFAKPEAKERQDLPVTEEPIKIKRKYYTLGSEVLSSSTPNQKKKTSRRTPIELPNSLPPTATNESQEITSTNEQVSMLKGLDEEQPKDTDNKLIDSDNSLKQCENLQSSKTKKKRKRDRKESFTQEREKTEKSVISMTIGPDVPSSTLLNNSKSMDRNSHIYFEDSTLVGSKNIMQATRNTRSVSIREQKKIPKIIFKCKLNEKDIGKPLVFPLKVINKDNKKRQPLIDIKENILLPPVDIAGLIKETTGHDLNITLQNNIAVAEEQVNLANESKIGVEDKETEERKSDSSRNETINNSEVANNHTNLKKYSENTKNVTKKPTNLEDSEKVDSANKDNKNESQGESTKKMFDAKDGNSLSSKADNLTDEASSSNKETDIDNNVTANNNCTMDITQGKTSKSVSRNTKDDTSVDESCVIDLDDEDDDEDVIDLSDVEDRKNASKNNSEILNKSITEMSVEEMLPFCTALTGIPKVGYVIVFKFNRKVLGDKMDVSEYIACKCEHVNRRTKILKLAIIDASQENNVIPHQYSCNLDDSINSDKFMNIRTTDMIDPKVLET